MENTAFPPSTLIHVAGSNPPIPLAGAGVNPPIPLAGAEVNPSPDIYTLTPSEVPVPIPVVNANTEGLPIFFGSLSMVRVDLTGYKRDTVKEYINGSYRTLKDKDVIIVYTKEALPLVRGKKYLKIQDFTVKGIEVQA